VPVRKEPFQSDGLGRPQTYMPYKFCMSKERRCKTGMA
jgi:hypothetical protein